MQKVLKIISVALLAIVTQVMAEPAPKKVFDIIDSQLKQYTTNAIIVAAVKAENAKKQTLADIKKKDEVWKSTAGYSDIMTAMQSSECGKFLDQIKKDHKYVAEIFVMDNQGANVAMSDKTSDYWQGDEPKFIESYKGGVGATHVSDVTFDESSQTYSVQVSLPIKDGKTVIGAVTFGIDLDAL